MAKTRKHLSKSLGGKDLEIKDDIVKECHDPKPAGRFIVVSPFVDRNDSEKTWREGDDVSHFDDTRLKSVLDRGLIKKG